jgi:hypothetical protein
VFTDTASVDVLLTSVPPSQLALSVDRYGIRLQQGPSVRTTMCSRNSAGAVVGKR